VVLFKAGDHVPVIPFKEVVGKAAKLAPAQIGATAAKVGKTLGFTTIVMDYRRRGTKGSAWRKCVRFSDGIA